MAKTQNDSFLGLRLVMLGYTVVTVMAVLAWLAGVPISWVGIGWWLGSAVATLAIGWWLTRN